MSAQLILGKISKIYEKKRVECIYLALIDFNDTKDQINTQKNFFRKLVYE